MRSKQLMLSPRSGAKQLKSIPTLELNSYKIDTSSLSQKAKQIELLKTQLETQISQYKSSQISYQQDLRHFSDENKELKNKIKRLQAELNQIKSQPPKNQKNPLQTEVKSLKNKIQDLQQQVSKLKKTLAEKEQVITEFQEYKKMYQIQVENKNNIMNFYENKLAHFQKDKVTLISKYQQRISQLGSGIEMNGTLRQTLQNLNSLSNPQNKTTTFNRISNFKDNQASSRQANNSGQLEISSKKNIKIIRTSKQPNKPNIAQGLSQSVHYQVETPYKMFNSETVQDSIYDKENSPQNRASKRQLNQISISSTLSKETNLLLSRKTKNKDSPRKSNQTTNNKILRNSDSFLKLIRQIFNNLKTQNIKSESLKNYTSVKKFTKINNPSFDQILQMFNSFPFSKIQMSRQEIEQGVGKMKKYLQKKYSLWSGNLVIELLVDKIQDFEIAYEVNSEDEGQIVAGLSSNEDCD